MAMDIAADEHRRRIASAYTVEPTGRQREAQGQRETGGRIRRRHDHPGRARYPLIGAVLRA